MITNITIRKFKSFDDVSIELGRNVVLIGPNNSGKTTALQALALWDIGLKQWNAKHKGSTVLSKRPGVTINRTDLIALPVPSANLLWNQLHTRQIDRSTGKQRTDNIRIDIIVEGITHGREWSCGLEFDYANEQSLYCRPLRLDTSKQPERMPVPDDADKMKIAFLPAMSGLAATEPKWEQGRINVLLGEGQTAQVLRNLCYQTYMTGNHWDDFQAKVKDMFNVVLGKPIYNETRGEISMTYTDVNGIELDISSSGRGMQQILLLLAHLYANPQTVLLLDEPDAHLEVLRQRQVYQILTNLASDQGSQIIAASHSEVILNEAADKDIVIAFVGKPHRIDDRGSQLLKSLKNIGHDQYYLAEQRGWVLYLEGSTDLSILQSFAEKLDHPAREFLKKPFVHYVGNQISAVQDHFFGIREACPNLVGVMIFDRLEREYPPALLGKDYLSCQSWAKREIENYVCTEEVLLAYAQGATRDDLFGRAEAEERLRAMRESIAEVTSALKTLHKRDPWSPDTKATDEFLDPLFATYFEKLNLANQMRKTDYHILCQYLSEDQIDNEVVEKLDEIARIAKMAD